MSHRLLVALAVVLAAAGVSGQSQPAGQGRQIPAATQHVLPERERVAVINRILQERLETVLPALMRETGFDMWLVVNREYVEDPVYLSLVPAPVFHARRLTMLVIADPGEGKPLDLMTVGRYPIGSYRAVWEGGDEAKQWARLAEVVGERNPKRIGINASRDWSFGDGLTAGLRDLLMESLGTDLAARTSSAEALAVRWLETRTPLELDLYAHITAIARGVIAEAFSERVITPGVTTTDDVAWYIRQRFTDLGLETWFSPYVNRQYAGGKCAADTPFCGDDGVIQRGDVLHTDVGIRYLRLNTDTQEMGYVLRRGEQDVPEGLRRALATGNRWQDLFTAEFVTGRTGDEIFARTDAACRREGIAHSTYTHAVGFHGHAAGMSVGMWDNQGPVPTSGAWTLRPNTAYAIEGNVKAAVPEWNGQLVQIKMEQTAAFDGTAVVYSAGRQTEWHVVR